MGSYIPPTPKMVNYLRNLARDHVNEQLGQTAEERIAYIDQQLANRDMDKFQAMGWIDDLKNAPRDTTDGTGVTPGMYLRNGDVYLVKPNREKTRLYAKRLIPISGTRVTESDEDVKADWDYQPGYMNLIRPEDRMTLEEAEPFMIRYTHCMVCGRFLKAATSVRHAIGPVCIKMFAEPVEEVVLDDDVEDRLDDLLVALGSR